MNDTNKNEYLDALRTASGVIDKIGYIAQGSNLVYDFTDADWTTPVAGGKLVNDSVINFENTSGSDISIIGVGIFSSGAQTLTSGSTEAGAAVDIYNFSEVVTLEDGEILRLSTYEYTVN